MNSGRKQSKLAISAIYLAYFCFITFFLLVEFDRLYPYPEISNEFSYARSALAVFLLIICISAFAYLPTESAPATIMHMFMVLSVVPALALYGTADVALWACIIYVYFLYLFVFLTKIVRIKYRKISLSEDKKANILLIFAILFTLYFFAIHRFSIDLGVFTLRAEDIYETRLEAAENRGQITRYFYSWSTKVFLPLAIVYGFITKRTPLVVFGLVSMSYLFATSGHKSVLLSVLLLIFLSGNQSFSKKNLIFTLGILGMLVLCYAVYIFFEYDQLQSLFIRRLLILPAILNQYYFNTYFGDYAFFSHSFLSAVFENTYFETPPYVVGLQYFNSETISANNGFISDGFANAGYFGATFQASVLAFLLVILCKIGISSRYYGFLFIFVYQFNTSATSTTLLSHGFLLLILLAFFGFTASQPLHRAAPTPG